MEGGDKKIGLTAVLSSDVDVEIGTVPITLKDAGLAPPEVVSPDTNAEDASFVLSASPSRVSEAMEEATIRVTATLNGGALSSDVTVNLSIDPASTAEEDEDYEWDIDDPLVIRAGSTSGSTEVFLEMEDDGESEGRETIILNGSAGGGLTVGSVEITLTDQTEPPDDSSLAFAAVIDDQTYTIDTAITPVVLPAATGGTGTLTYAVSSLPTGLSFDPATRTLSGTPTAATDGALPVVYQVTDGAAQVAVLTFTITVNALLTFDLSDLFGTGKVVPTAVPDGATLREFVVGQRVDGLVLPAGSGGSAPLTYSVSPALPVGLTFDATTRNDFGYAPRWQVKPSIHTRLRTPTARVRRWRYRCCRLRSPWRTTSPTRSTQRRRFSMRCRPRRTWN